MSSSDATTVEVRRVIDGERYARVSTIGQKRQRPFLLVAGIGVASNYYERLAPNLNEFGPVHALDLPGFAGVPHPDRAMSIRDYADLVGRVIDELELDDPVVVGHSMGTQVVADLASRRPELSSIVLIGPVVNAHERRIPLQAVRFLQASWHEPLRVKVLAVGAYLLCGFRWFSRVLPEMIRFPLEERLPSIQAHTLVIRGEFDAVAPREWVDTVSELLPHSRAFEIPGAAHSVMHAHAEEVARLCVEHARRPRDDDDDLRVAETVDERADADSLAVGDRPLEHRPREGGRRHGHRERRPHRRGQDRARRSRRGRPLGGPVIEPVEIGSRQGRACRDSGPPLLHRLICA